MVRVGACALAAMETLIGPHKGEDTRGSNEDFEIVPSRMLGGSIAQHAAGWQILTKR